MIAKPEYFQKDDPHARHEELLMRYKLEDIIFSNRLLACGNMGPTKAFEDAARQLYESYSVGVGEEPKFRRIIRNIEAMRRNESARLVADAKEDPVYQDLVRLRSLMYGGDVSFTVGDYPNSRVFNTRTRQQITDHRGEPLVVSVDDRKYEFMSGKLQAVVRRLDKKEVGYVKPALRRILGSSRRCPWPEFIMAVYSVADNITTSQYEAFVDGQEALQD